MHKMSQTGDDSIFTHRASTAVMQYTHNRPTADTIGETGLCSARDIRIINQFLINRAFHFAQPTPSVGLL